MLVAASVVLGARLLGAEEPGVEVWAADRDLQLGEEVGPDDLTLVTIGDAAGAWSETYLRGDDEWPEGRVLARSLGAGELLPRSALGHDSEGRVEVALWAPVVAVPTGVRAGSVVDVWVTVQDGGTSLALQEVTVVAAPEPAQGLGPSGDRQVVLSVPQEKQGAVGEVLAAAHDGSVSITRRR